MPQKNRQKKILEILRDHKIFLSERFGVTDIGIFGSIARGEDHALSDVDIVIKTKIPDLFLLVNLKEELERLLEADVDLVRYWPRMNPYLKKRIDNDVHYA